MTRSAPDDRCGRPAAEVLLVAHGSAQHGATSAVEQLRATLSDRLAADTKVRTAYLDHAGTRPAAALIGLYDTGCRSVRLVPLLFAGGYHLRIDLPAEVAAATAQRRCLVTSTAPALAEPGADPYGLLLAALDERVALPGTALDGLILVSAGSSSRTARSAVDALSQQWGSRRGVPALAAFASGTGHTVAAAAALLRSRGCSGIGVGGLFVAPGALPTRARAAARAEGLPPPAVLGGTDSLIELLAQRAQQHGAYAAS